MPQFNHLCNDEGMLYIEVIQVYKPITQGDDGSLGAVGDTQLGEDFAGVIAYRALGEVEHLGDIGSRRVIQVDKKASQQVNGVIYS